MTALRDSPLSAPVRLGAPLTLVPGEWLHSAISRWAWHDFGVSRGALFRAFGLTAVPEASIPGIGTRLLPEIATNIAYATGIPESQLHDATMSCLNGGLIQIRIATRTGYLSGRVAKEHLWSWQAGTRYCPECLTERPGVFYLRWRTPWAFCCMKHRRVLLDGCCECHAQVVEMRHREATLFNPSTCRARLEANVRTSFCRADLRQDYDDYRLPESSPVLEVHRLLVDSEADGSTRGLLGLLQAAATGLRAAKAYDEIAELSGIPAEDLLGLFDDEQRIGVSAPGSSFAMAALVGAAYTLTRLEGRQTREIIRRSTFARAPAFVPRGAGLGPGSPAELLSRWPKAPSRFQAQILAAHDSDFTVGQRVLWDTSPEFADTGRSYDPDQRFSHVPQALWPEWCSRLDVGGAVDADTLSQALATAVRLNGSRGERSDTDNVAIARVLRPNLLGSPEETDRILAGIAALARSVDYARDAVDYPSRTDLPVDDLLQPDHWAKIAESVDIDPGSGRKRRNARRYLWQRLTATLASELEGDLAIGRTRADGAEYTNFRTLMTFELQRALDEYARAFLLHHGCDEPVIWSPEVSADIRWPGPDILDLDAQRLYDMLANGVVAQHRLAVELQVSPRRVLRAIDVAPPLARVTLTSLDWTAIIPPRDALTAWEATASRVGASAPLR
jgi:hypothetical protein